MIRCYKNKQTQTVAQGKVPKGFPADLARPALRKLTMLHYAERLEDVMWPPGNRLERLAGDRKGQYSIRINDQWCICFVWKNGGADDVEIVDYH